VPRENARNSLGHRTARARAGRIVHFLRKFKKLVQQRAASLARPVALPEAEERVHRFEPFPSLSATASSAGAWGRDVRRECELLRMQRWRWSSALA